MPNADPLRYIFVRSNSIIGGMAFAMAGLYVSDAMEDKLDPAKRQAHETATMVEPVTEPRK